MRDNKETAFVYMEEDSIMLNKQKESTEFRDGSERQNPPPTYHPPLAHQGV